MTKRILLSSIVCCTLASNISAEETVALDTIRIWETEVVSSSLNLGKDVIETKQADHLSDLLKDLPGVDVGGTHSVNNRINIRGLQDENLDITLDGAKIQNANMFHHIGNLLINPDILKRAEIQVGTNSVVSGSLGGSVAFETKDGRDMLKKGQTFGARVSTTYNSNDSLGGSISGYGKVNENLDLLIYHNHIDKNNWEDGEGTETFGVEGKVKNTLIKFGVDFLENQRVSFSYDRLSDKGDYAPRPDFGRDYNEARTGLDTFPTEYVRDTFTLKHELDLGNKLFLDTTLYSNENDLERYEGPLSSGAPVRPPFGISAPSTNLEGLLKGTVKTKGINIKGRTNLETGEILHTLTYGGLYDKQTSKVTWDGAKYGDDEEATYGAVFIENAMDFNNGLVLTPGIRFNTYELDGAYGMIDDNKVTYGLSAEYGMTNGLTLLASATTLFKGVEMVDVLASNRFAVADNPNLKSETGINKELGFRYLKSGVLGADDIGFSFKYFQTDIKDYIHQAYNEMSNMGKLKIDGFEANFAYNKGDFSTLLTYSHSDSKFDETGEPLIKEPGDSISIGIDYKLASNIDLAWESLFVREEDDIQSSGGYQIKKAYNVHDIALRYIPQAMKSMTIVAGIENIFDEEYTSHISENRALAPSRGSTTTYSTADLEPGRNFKITLSYKF